MSARDALVLVAGFVFALAILAAMRGPRWLVVVHEPLSGRPLGFVRTAWTHTGAVRLSERLSARAAPFTLRTADRRSTANVEPLQRAWLGSWSEVKP